VLLDGSDLGVDSRLIAQRASLANRQGVLLESAEQDGIDLAVEITSSLGVGKGLVGNNLLQAVQVGNIGRTKGGSGIAQQREDGVLNLEGVVQLQCQVGSAEDGLVRVLLRHLAPPELIPVL